MQYTNRAILSMIASALTPLIFEGHTHSDHIAFRADLAELKVTPDRDTLIAYMTDGRQFQITVEEVL